MARPLIHIGAGAALTAIAGLAAWLYILAIGQPFGTWGWTALAFCLMVVATLVLAVLATVSGPFEPRLQRWRVAGDPLGRGAIDPLAIGYQMDLAATESNPPRTVTGESRWLWIAAAPLIAVVVLGITLATSGDGAPKTALTSDHEAITIAERAVRDSMPHTGHLQTVGHELTTAAIAAGDFADAVPFAVGDPETLVYIVYFLTEQDLRAPDGPMRAGPAVAIDAETGAVLGLGTLSFNRDRR